MTKKEEDKIIEEVEKEMEDYMNGLTGGNEVNSDPVDRDAWMREHHPEYYDENGNLIDSHSD